MKAAKTNIELYGKDFYRKIGARGGAHGHSGGFAANPALASIAGAKGGKKSRRGAGSTVELIIEPQAKHIEKMYNSGYSIPQIAEDLEVSYTTLLKWAKKNLPSYGEPDDIEFCEKVLEHEDGRDI